MCQGGWHHLRLLSPSLGRLLNYSAEPMLTLLTVPTFIMQGYPLWRTSKTLAMSLITRTYMTFLNPEDRVRQFFLHCTTCVSCFLPPGPADISD